MSLRTMVQSRAVLALGVIVTVAVPALTMPHLPADGSLSRGWHVRAYAESELLGLLTPGHVGADVWRVRRLTQSGLARGDALTSVGADRVIGAIGLTCFVVFATCHTEWSRPRR